MLLNVQCSVVVVVVVVVRLVGVGGASQGRVIGRRLQQPGGHKERPIVVAERMGKGKSNRVEVGILLGVVILLGRGRVMRGMRGI